jgi:hypothetical protein
MALTASRDGTAILWLTIDWDRDTPLTRLAWWKPAWLSDEHHASRD